MLIIGFISTRSAADEQEAGINALEDANLQNLALAEEEANQPENLFDLGYMLFTEPEEFIDLIDTGITSIGTATRSLLDFLFGGSESSDGGVVNFVKDNFLLIALAGMIGYSVYKKNKEEPYV